MLVLQPPDLSLSLPLPLCPSLPLSLSLSLSAIAPGILRMFQLRLLECQTIEEVGQFLGKLPPDMDSNALFQNISAINLTSKKFTHILQQHIKH